MFLASKSRMAASSYLRIAVQLCRVHGINPSILLHPLDLWGCDDDQDLSFFPGMNLKSEYKRDVFLDAFDLLQHHFELVTMQTHAAVAQGSRLKRHRCLREGNPAHGAATIAVKDRRYRNLSKLIE